MFVFDRCIVSAAGLAVAAVVSLAAPAEAEGYRIVTMDGTVRSFGEATPDPSPASLRSAPIVCIVSNPAGDGYWLLTAKGGVLSFGGAAFHGAPLQAHDRFVAMAATPTGGGYWLVTAAGGVFTYGDAPFLGTAVGRNGDRVVGIASTPDGGGYWLLSAGGAVWTFGNAPFEGSASGFAHNGSFVGIASTPTGRGYWLTASGGGVFTFGDAPFFGSRSGTRGAPIVAIASIASGEGYRLLGRDGGVFSFGSAGFDGSAVGSIRADAVGIADQLGGGGCSAADDESVPARVDAAISYAATRAGTAGFAIIDGRTGELLGNPAGTTVLKSASIIKVIIAMTLLSSVEERHRPLTSDERRDLTAMIRVSDNNATSRLWSELGGPSTIDWVRRAITIEATRPPTVSDEWGFTTTNAHDMVRVLDGLTLGHVLSRVSADTLLNIMRQVDPAQRWGIAEVTRGSAAVKNGWYLDSEPARWRVHCLGIVADASATNRWLISIMTAYPAERGITYGQATCRGLAVRLLPSR